MAGRGGPRDGPQNEAAILPTADRVHLIERSIAAGLHRIEAVSFVSPKRVPQMADAQAGRGNGLIACRMCRGGRCRCFIIRASQGAEAE
jgi:isopropylmalate/homocitrate/citramalate synthase